MFPVPIIVNRHRPGENGEAYHLRELGVLHHHGMNNSQEALIRREYTRSACQSIALHKSLAKMLTQNLNDTATLRIGEFVPLEVPASMRENSI